jgi:hypothetical protein
MNKVILLSFATLAALFVFGPVAGGHVPAAIAAGPDQVSSMGTSAHLTAYATFQGDPITAPRSNGTPQVKPSGPTVIPFRGPTAQEGLEPTIAGLAPSVESSSLTGNLPSTVLVNVDGMSDKINKAKTGGENTPPDQGLCAGLNSSSTKVIYEPVNVVIGAYSPTGGLLGSNSLVNFFGDANAFSDPRCFYDDTTNTWFFTVISWGGTGTDTFTDIGVVNSSGAGALYKFDTSWSSTCFGDQPHVGYDNNNLYISQDDFCGPTYSGADLWMFSKSQLVSESSTVNGCAFSQQSLGGVPVLTMQPAVSPGASTEYLLNSFPWKSDGTPNPSSTKLGLWEVDGGSNVGLGNCGSVTLTGKLITSEKYAYTVSAKSTGTGACSKIGSLWVCSEKAINPDDDRMQQTELVTLGGKPTLWGALTSAVSIKGDTATRDGIAWFEVDPVGKSILNQGYLASKGNYLIYPAIFATTHGTDALVFTITSPTRNPSAAYFIMGSTTINVASSGSSAHKSFANKKNGSQFRFRWGDYSAAVLDPNGHDIWMATEYIPSSTNQDPLDNWGTRVFDLKGN